MCRITDSEPRQGRWRGGDSDDKDKVTNLPSPSSCARGFLLISPGTTRPSSSWRSQTRSQTSLRGQRRVYSRPAGWKKLLTHRDAFRRRCSPQKAAAAARHRTRPPHTLMEAEPHCPGINTQSDDSRGAERIVHRPPHSEPRRQEEELALTRSRALYYYKMSANIYLTSTFFLYENKKEDVDEENFWFIREQITLGDKLINIWFDNPQS